MRSYRLAAFLGLLLTVRFAFAGSPATAATPGFTITATNVTMSSSDSIGIGSSSLTLTSIGGYTGTVNIGCNIPTPKIGVTVPSCNYGAAKVVPPGPVPPPITLAANQMATGAIAFYNPVPCSGRCGGAARLVGHGLQQSLALAGVLLVGFGFRRRAPRWLALMLFALGTLAGISGISACGGNNTIVTPGTYVYTISAIDISTDVSVTTQINVTVP